MIVPVWWWGAQGMQVRRLWPASWLPFRLFGQVADRDPVTSGILDLRSGGFADVAVDVDDVDVVGQINLALVKFVKGRLLGRIVVHTLAVSVLCLGVWVEPDGGVLSLRRMGLRCLSVLGRTQEH